MSSETSLSVLMTTDTVGGVWTYTIELCKALQNNQVVFHLVTAGAPMNDSQREEVNALKNVTVYETDFLLEWMENPWESMEACGNYLLQLESQVNPAIIHLNGFVLGSLKWKAPVVLVAHSDVYSWWQSVKNEQPPAVWNEYYKRVKDGLTKADYLVAPSNWMMNSILNNFQVTTKSEVIYNGRDAGLFFKAAKQSYIFSMGRVWDEAKNIALLAKAAAKVMFPVRIAGDNYFANNSFEAEGKNVEYLGKLTVADVAQQLSTAAIYALPARYEPFGLSVLEAALSGCALVLGNIHSLKEIWGEAAVYGDTDDEDGLATSINNLLQDDQLRQQYASAAMEKAKNYSTQKMATNYLEVYRRLLAIN